MALKLMYITNRPDVARIAVDAGVDRIFIDMEVLGKAQRQGGMDTVQSHHVPGDIRHVREAVGRKAEIIARINPINPGSKAEVDAVIENGADIIMLPMWKSVAEVTAFLSFVGGRCRTMLLLETAEAAEIIKDVVKIPGVDEIHIGLNDLHLSYGRKFLFELLADGTVERLTSIIHASGIPYGFGGIARPGSGTLPAERIMGEHYRLGSQIVILSRSFCNTEKVTDQKEIKKQFDEGVADIRRVEAQLQSWQPEQFEQNRREVVSCVEQIVSALT